MPQNLLAINGVVGLVCAVGEGGRILMFRGDLYRPVEVQSPTTATLRGVWVNTPDDAWAVGDGVILRWDGRVWYKTGLNPRAEDFTAIWGHADDGAWLGSARCIVNFRSDGGGTLVHTDLAVRSIWGSGPSDVWYLCSDRTLLHWANLYCNGEVLPGDEDEEWTAVAGSGPEDSVYVVGIYGLVMEWNRSCWWELTTDTRDRLTAACSTGTDDLWVTTTGGQIRHWDGDRWRVVAFSAFGALRGCCAVDGVIWACGDRGVVIQHQPDDGGSKE